MSDSDATSHTNRRPRWQVEKRRELLRELLVQRRTNREYARVLGVSRRTIERDLTAIRIEDRSSIAMTTTLDVAAEVRRDYEHDQRRLAQMLEQRLDPKNARSPYAATRMERIAVIQTRIRNRTEYVKTMQSLGLTLKAPDRLEVQHVLMQRLDALEPTVLEEIAELKGDELVKRLADVLGVEFTAAMIGTDVPLQLTRGKEDENE